MDSLTVYEWVQMYRTSALPEGDYFAQDIEGKKHLLVSPVVDSDPIVCRIIIRRGSIIDDDQHVRAFGYNAEVAFVPKKAAEALPLVKISSTLSTPVSIAHSFASVKADQQRNRLLEHEAKVLQLLYYHGVLPISDPENFDRIIEAGFCVSGDNHLWASPRGLAVWGVPGVVRVSPALMYLVYTSSHLRTVLEIKSS